VRLSLSTNTGRAGSKPRSACHSGSRSLLRRLRLAGQGAEHRAAVAGQAFEVQHLRAGVGQRLQQPALAAARAAAQHAEVCSGAGSVSSSRSTARRKAR
jgi:hypothetical protein